MTEDEWRQSNDPFTMVRYLKGKAVATPRKLALFSLTSLRRYLSAHPVVGLLDVAERFIEGPVSNEERRSALASFQAKADPPSGRLDLRAHSMNLVRNALINPLDGSGYAMEWYYHAEGATVCSRDEPAAAAHDAGLLRDIFFSPLARRIPRITPTWHSWNSGTIPKMAETIYADRAFGDLPILADALEEAGCTNADILAHCRGAAPHVRGCWVVDLLTGRK